LKRSAKIGWMAGTAASTDEAVTKIVDLLTERQAEDVVLLDIRDIASFTDYFVIATAQNQRHLRALVDSINTDLARVGIKTSHIEGNDDSGWVLVDFGDVILHIFTPEERAFYKLEALWTRSGVPAVRFQ
jgi:ribosome-associated protein